MSPVSKSLAPPVTAAHRFENVGTDRFLLSVVSGVSVEASLNLASCRLAEVLEFLREQSEHDEGISQNSLFILQNQIETAKAMLDAGNSGLMAFESSMHKCGGQQ